MTKNVFKLYEEVKIGGKVYKLEYDKKAYIALEKMVGKNVFYIYKKLVIEESYGVDLLEKVAMSGLLKHHTKQEISELLILPEDIANLFEIRNEVILAFIKPFIRTKKKKGSIKARKKPASNRKKAVGE